MTPYLSRAIANLDNTYQVLYDSFNLRQLPFTAMGSTECDAGRLVQVAVRRSRESVATVAQFLGSQLWTRFRAGNGNRVGLPARDCLAKAPRPE
jgi:hypothetical protein